MYTWRCNHRLLVDVEAVKKSFLEGGRGLSSFNIHPNTEIAKEVINRYKKEIDRGDFSWWIKLHTAYEYEAIIKCFILCDVPFLDKINEIFALNILDTGIIYGVVLKDNQSADDYSLNNIPHIFLEGYKGNLDRKPFKGATGIHFVIHCYKDEFDYWSDKLYDLFESIDGELKDDLEEWINQKEINVINM